MTDLLTWLEYRFGIMDHSLLRFRQDGTVPAYRFHWTDLDGLPVVPLTATTFPS